MFSWKSKQCTDEKILCRYHWAYTEQQLCLAMLWQEHSMINDTFTQSFIVLFELCDVVCGNKLKIEQWYLEVYPYTTLIVQYHEVHDYTICM